MSTEGFETFGDALQFGDFLWDNLLSHCKRLDVSEVRETHIRWKRPPWTSCIWGILSECRMSVVPKGPQSQKIPIDTLRLP